jgi:hypothetical protein
MEGVTRRSSRDTKFMHSRMHCGICLFLVGRQSLSQSSDGVIGEMVPSFSELAGPQIKACIR